MAKTPPIASKNSISGHCWTGTIRKTGLGKVILSFGTSSARSCVSKFDGAYTTAPVPPGKYILTPKLAGYVFTPQSATITVGGTPVSGVDFIGREDGT